MFIDSHCHLDFPELVGRLDEVFTRMRDNLVAAGNFPPPPRKGPKPAAKA